MKSPVRDARPTQRSKPSILPAKERLRRRAPALRDKLQQPVDDVRPQAVRAQRQARGVAELPRRVAGVIAAQRAAFAEFDASGTGGTDSSRRWKFSWAPCPRLGGRCEGPEIDAGQRSFFVALRFEKLLHIRGRLSERVKLRRMQFDEDFSIRLPK